MEESADEIISQTAKIAEFYYIHRMDVNINCLNFAYQCLPIDAIDSLQEFEKRVIFGRMSSDKMTDCAVF